MGRGKRANGGWLLGALLQAAPAQGAEVAGLVDGGVPLARDAQSASSLPDANQGMRWHEGSLFSALRLAQASRRWVLLEVAAAWCGPCQQLDAQVWWRPEVALALERAFVPLRRDGELGDGVELARRYHVVGFPTLLVLDERGVEVDRIMGFVGPKELTERLLAFRAGEGTLATLERRLRGAAHDLGLRFEVGQRYALRGDARALEELGRVANEDAGNRLGLAAKARFIVGKYYWQRGKGDAAQALRCFEQLESEHPASPEVRDQVPYCKALALHGVGRDAEAQQQLDRWLEANPTDEERANAYAWLCYKQGFARRRGIEVAEQALGRHPTSDALWDTLGELYAAEGRLDEARAAAVRALALKPAERYYQQQLKKRGGSR